ncbi:unnamed protein product [Gulo gulo]|uniref:Uncharacterized protein n=1 Tax=Gulo gulo TaxID=48420 RepID=A0A9X9LJS7_GULGU|nr:unnamed protein product [Gulo gulo]
MGHQKLYWSHLRKFVQGSHGFQICSNRHSLAQKNVLQYVSPVFLSVWKRYRCH